MSGHTDARMQGLESKVSNHANHLTAKKLSETTRNFLVDSNEFLAGRVWPDFPFRIWKQEGQKGLQ